MGSWLTKRRWFHVLCVSLIVAGNASATVRYDCPMTGARQQTRCCCAAAAKTPVKAQEGAQSARPKAGCCDLRIAGSTPYLSSPAKPAVLLVALPEVALAPRALLWDERAVRAERDRLAVPLQILFCAFLC